MNNAQQTLRRRSRLRLTAGLVVALVTAGAPAAVPAFAAPAAPGAAQPASMFVPKDPVAAVAAMQPSWNLGNTLDAIPDETSWGNPLTTKALFDRIRAEGFRSVRIPVTWSGHQSATAPYTIDPAWMARVRQVVDLALADGLYVEINVHHDSWQWINKMSTDHDNVLARFNATWQQIATAFKDEPRKLLMESINEPQFADSTDAQRTQYLRELNTSFHTIVRGSGGVNKDRLLVLPSEETNNAQHWLDDLSTTMSSLHDRNLVATVHYYSFWPFSVNVANGTTYDARTQADLTEGFARVHDTFVAKGIPVYLGEYGLLSEPNSGIVERGEMLKYYEHVNYVARANGITTALWDDANYLNRATMQWRDPALMALIKSSWRTRSGTASTDNLFLPKSGPITAQTVTLNPNGLWFAGLWQGDRPLIPFLDYTLSGDRLTLTADTLTRLAGDRAHGLNATLQVRYSDGVPWQLNVRTSEQPGLSDATGTADGITIPTRFNGDLLANVESTYADGSAAGPYGWTTYQEFNNYAADYDANTTAVKAGFIQSLKDDAPVTLTFRFWSGATVTYHVTKSGTTVTGTAS
ncbi:cellulase family glycosylhydrolase [Kitasatospora atroaurantiaca]|uniref:Aryl-phospho-beta-D-glucosidase BglC (GH1 family) n=1 Tax=Kitasatospora atroaurantiaca TaxID=285545 RepID=A0A561F0D6_9ACTN|nr:cellulase family glycosylhydrolase [Kitasatospora atroaurantiaca]TWE21321.1 aryl-phospho-beta-D-glucosidase BglC (GH1 family) [Kitasatospora atroaurantiaca]